MSTRVRCLKCSKIIECSPYHTSILLQHIKDHHPEIKLPDDDTMHQQESKSPREVSNETLRNGISNYQLPPASDQMEEITIRHPGQKPVYTRKYKVYQPQEPRCPQACKSSQSPKSPQTPRSPQRRRMYKTSIEKWRPAKGTIYCPKCGVNKKPIIRSRSEKMSSSTVGAACILTCWPLCFLPCLFSSPAREFLHCADCNNFLGMYDKENNCVRPNRDFVESGECQKSSCDNLSKKTSNEDEPEGCQVEEKALRENA